MKRKAFLALLTAPIVVPLGLQKTRSEVVTVGGVFDSKVIDTIYLENKYAVVVKLMSRSRESNVVKTHWEIIQLS